MNFLKQNWKFILIGLTSLIVGFFLNRYSNQQSEKRIIDSLIAEIKILKEKQSISRITADEQKRIIELQAQLNLFNLN